MKRRFLTTLIITLLVAAVAGAGLLFAAQGGLFGSGVTNESASGALGLIGHWRFDEGAGSSAFDASGNAKTGTLIAMATTTNGGWSIGNSSSTGLSGGGGALNFDGTDDYVSVASPSLPTGDFTYSAWVYLDLNTDEAILMAANGSGGNEFLMYVGSNNKLQIELASTGVLVSGTTTIPTAQWNFVSVTRSGGTVTPYVNGVVDGASWTNSTTLSFSTCALLIAVDADAACAGTLGNYLDGKIDDVRVYNRALTLREIKMLYNNGAPVIWYKFDEGSGGTALNSASSTDGTLTYMSTSTASGGWTTGKYGGGLDFDGVDDYVDTNMSKNYASSAFTISIWVQRRAKITSGGDLVTKRSLNATTVTDFPLVLVINAGGTISWSLSKGDDFSTDSNIDSKTSLDTTSWYHVEATYEATTSHKLYINGRKENEANIAFQISENSRDWRLGQPVTVSRSTASTTYLGKMDDFRLYDYARSDEQVLADYNENLSAHIGPARGAEQSSTPNLQNGLVGLWKFDEGAGTSAFDASGRGGTGTLTYMATSTSGSWTKGNSTSTGLSGGGGALNFDGVDDFVRQTLPEAMKVATSSVSVAAWIKINVNNAQQTIVAASPRGADGDGRGVELDISSGGKVVLQKGSADGAYETVTGATTVTTGAWHHVAGTFDGATMLVYLDGVQDASSANTQTISWDDQASGNYPDPAQLFFGAYKTNVIGGGATTPDGRFLNGSIDDLRFYAARALTAQEIRMLYSGQRPVAYWKFDEGATTTAFDSGTGANKGTLRFMSTSTFGGWRMGKYGGALNFDGIDDYVDLGVNAVGPDVNGAGALTVSAWVITREYPATGSRVRLLTVFLANGTTGFSLNFNGSLLEIGGRSQSSDGFQTATSTFPAKNEWHYATGIFDFANSKMYLYIDGAQKTAKSVAFGSTTYVQGTPTTIVDSIGSNNTGGENSSSTLDEVRVYAYARNSEQILADYNEGAALRVGVAGSGNSGQNTTPDLNRGLVGLWKFDEGAGSSAFDTISRGNTGTLKYMATSTNGGWKSGNSSSTGISGGGGSLYFDGSDDYVSVANEANFDFERTDPFSVSVWFKSTSAASQALVFKQNGQTSPYTGWFLAFGENSAGDIRFALINNGGTNAIKVYTTTGGFNDGAWHHVAATYTGSSAASGAVIYIDGLSRSLTIQQDNLTASILNNCNVQFGTNCGFAQPFNGSIDEPRIYNRTLTAQEVRMLYNGGSPVAYWKFDEGATTTAFDSAGANDGTLNNMSTSSFGGWRKGRFGNALEFDGVDDYVSVPDSNSLDITSSTTISFWIKGSTSASTVILEKSNDNTNYHFQTANEAMTGGGQNIFFGVSATAATGRVSTNVVIMDGAWHFIAGTFDTGIDTLQIYVDGVLNKSNPGATDNLSANTSSLLIGSRSGAAAFPGFLDDIRIYNYIRTPQQILQDYNGGKSIYFR